MKTVKDQYLIVGLGFQSPFILLQLLALSCVFSSVCVCLFSFCLFAKSADWNAKEGLYTKGLLMAALRWRVLDDDQQTTFNQPIYILINQMQHETHMQLK